MAFKIGTALHGKLLSEESSLSTSKSHGCLAFLELHLTGRKLSGDYIKVFRLHVLTDVDTLCN